MIRHASMRTTLSHWLNLCVTLRLALQRRQVTMPADVEAALKTVERWVGDLEERERRTFDSYRT